ncbi:hypothetical protein C8Q75DRAFT_732834 [Abortiporus biennis]|nr:hypothetical protein C8Q75DRAFT_732834 [Abortiporus biennis]
MLDLHIVLEEPHLASGRKKRPRLVTSCDSCRLKKIKCIREEGSATGVCEACAAAHVACRYKDRERYYAEKMKRTTSNFRRAHRSNSESSTPEPANMRGYGTDPSESSRESTPSSSSLMYPPSTYTLPYLPQFNEKTYEPSYILKPCAMAPSEADSCYYQDLPDSLLLGWQPPVKEENNASIDFTTGMNYISPMRSFGTNLFDPNRRLYPNPILMTSFIHTFFNTYGGDFPFLSYDSIIRQHHEQTMSPIMATCIAALGARHSDNPEIISYGCHNVQDIYSSHAQSLLQNATHLPPDLDLLHSIIMFSWIEYKRGRKASFQSYSQLAMSIAANMGLASSAYSFSGSQSLVIRSTWTSLSLLTQVATTL